MTILTRALTKSTAAVGAVLLAGALSLGAAEAQTTGAAATPAPIETSETPIGDWVKRCTKANAESAERCRLEQNVYLGEDQQQRVLLAVVFRPPGAQQTGLLLILPLGMALPPGVGLQIDGEELGRVPVERCEPSGCRVEILLNEESLARFKGGNRAQILFQDSRRQQIKVSLSLIGFTKGVDEVIASAIQ